MLPVSPSPARRTPSPPLNEESDIPPRSAIAEEDNREEQGSSSTKLLDKKKRKANPPPPADKKRKKKGRTLPSSEGEDEDSDDDLDEDEQEDAAGRQDPVIIDLTGDVSLLVSIMSFCISSYNFQDWGEPVIKNLEVAKVCISGFFCLYSHSQISQLSPEEVPLHLFHPVEGKAPLDYAFRAPSSVVCTIFVYDALN